MGKSITAWLRPVRALTQRLIPNRGTTRIRPAQLEIAWTAADREAIWGSAVAAAPREGATLALCRRSTGRSRETFIVQQPLLPEPGDLSYARGWVVSVTSLYLNRIIDRLGGLPPDFGIAVLHTHPGHGVPEWSGEDDQANQDLARFLFGEGFLKRSAPLLSLVGTQDALRGQLLEFEAGRSTSRPITRMRTLGLKRIAIDRTADHPAAASEAIPASADRSIRVFGRDGHRLLADLHVAVVGVGGVGSMISEHLARLGIGRVSVWDADVVKDVNINRSGIFTFTHAAAKAKKASAVAEALPSFSLVRGISVLGNDRDVRLRAELPDLLNADLIIMTVDDARPRHFVNRIAFAHYIPVLDGGNVIRSTAENNRDANEGTIEDGGVRISVLMPGGPCLWCAGHLTPERLSLAYRTAEEIAADRARGYVEGLGPEHAPSVIPVNVMTAALLECRLQDLLFHLSDRAVAEVYYGIIDGRLDELPRTQKPSCRHCRRWEGTGDAAELDFADG